MFTLLCKICLLLNASVGMHQNSSASPGIDLKKRAVYVRIQQVEFKRGVWGAWETNEFDRMRQSSGITTFSGQEKTLSIDTDLEQLIGGRDKNTRFVPMQLKITPTRNPEDYWAVRLQLELKLSVTESIRLDSTQYTLNGGRTYFVIPLPPRRDKDVFFAIMVGPSLMSEQDTSDLRKSRPLDAPKSPTP